MYGPAENFPESVKEKIVSASTLIKDEAQLAETKKELDLTYLVRYSHSMVPGHSVIPLALAFFR